MQLDIVVLGIPIILGLLLMWLGVRRSLLSLPVRLLVALVVAWLASSVLSVYLVVGHYSLDGLAQLFGLPPPMALGAVSWFVFVLVVPAVLIILSRIRSHALQNATHSVGIVPSIMRFVIGSACGLLLVLSSAVPTLLFYEAMLPDSNQLALEFQGSLSFPMLKYVTDRARRWLQAALPATLEGPSAAVPTP